MLIVQHVSHFCCIIRLRRDSVNDNYLYRIPFNYLSGSSKREYLRKVGKLSPAQHKRISHKQRLLIQLYKAGVTRGSYIPHDFGFAIYYHRKMIGGWDEYQGVQFFNPNWNVDDINSPETVRWLNSSIISMKLQKMMKEVW